MLPAGAATAIALLPRYLAIARLIINCALLIRPYISQGALIKSLPIRYPLVSYPSTLGSNRAIGATI